jgi:hypothetical protein
MRLAGILLDEKLFDEALKQLSGEFQLSCKQMLLTEKAIFSLRRLNWTTLESPTRLHWTRRQKKFSKTINSN